MTKSLFYKLFGLRKLPQETRKRLESEGIVFDEEGTSCALSYKKFRGPRNSSSRGWESASVGSLVITERTFYVQFPYMIVCDISLDIARKNIKMELKNDSMLIMKFNVEALFASCTGGLTCYWRLSNAREIYQYLM